jgi:hypothetical protein
MTNIWREERKDALMSRYEKAVGTFCAIPLSREGKAFLFLFLPP